MSGKLLPITITCLFLAACSCPSQRSADPSPGTATSTAGRVLYPSEGEIRVLAVQNGIARLKVHKKEGQSVYLRFSSGDYRKLSGKIVSPDPLANIRFDQITMPDGEMDGPFSREIIYDLPVQGDYLLRISESLMAGDPWAGEFEVIISLAR